MIPNSLVIEGMAQTGGLLVCEHNQFTEKVILAKMPKAVFHCAPRPATRSPIPPRSSTSGRKGRWSRPPATRATCLHAEAELVFAHLNDSRVGSLFEPETFLRMMRLLGAFDVGHAADGSRLQPPKRLLEAAMYGETPAPGERILATVEVAMEMSSSRPEQLPLPQRSRSPLAARRHDRVGASRHLL